MVDLNAQEFQSRVRQIKKDHDRGQGFEAEGTLGRSHYGQRRRFRIPLMAPVLFLTCGVIMLKAAIHFGIGGALYEHKVERLWEGTGLARVAAVVMQ
ncbi:MAG: hypothetical protein Q7J57_14270, partial [Gemmobacter sp.]|nr:hypothetical protein [Gemmobacter sp.]